MLIDDELVDHMQLDRLVARSGLVGKVLHFRLAEEALAFLQGPDRVEIDLLLLDMNMPRMTGLEFLTAAYAAMGPAFVRRCAVMLTTPLTLQNQARAEGFAVVKGFIRKPLTAEDLIAISHDSPI